MKILLLSAAGQVGYELHRSLAPWGEVIATTRDGRLPGGAAAQALELTDADALHNLLARHQPDLIVNASAYTAVDRAESEPELAHRLNAQVPAQLAQWCAARGARLLHYSTDYVFNGQSERPWREDDECAPLGVYGHSKRDGELAVLQSGAEYLILRTAWVYAARGHNFLRTMLRLGAERESLRVVADQIGTPTPARWIAEASLALLVHARGEGWQSGIVHLTAQGETSWHGFAEAIFEDALAAGLMTRRPVVEAIASSQYPTPAARPAYSRLDTQKLQQQCGLQLPDWREGVSRVIAELAP